MYFAEVIDGVVVNIIKAEQSFIDFYKAHSLGQWIQCSYNTLGNVHILGGTPLRGNFPGRGYIYDYDNDVFYPPQPYPTWILSSATWTWEAPVAYPGDGVEYRWDEGMGDWVLIDYS